MPTGYLPLFRLRGTPVSMHWTLPLVAFAAGAVVSEDLFPVLPALQWLGLVCAHVAGHVLVAQTHGIRVVELRLHSLGGRALTTGRLDLRGKTSLAWGGVLGQMGAMALLLLPVVLDRSLLDSAGFLAPIQLNGLLLAANLLPFGELDGALGWPRLARALQGPPTDPRDPLSVPGLDRRVERVSSRLRVVRHDDPGAAPGSDAAPGSPSPEMPDDIVRAADALIDELWETHRAPPGAGAEDTDEAPPDEAPPDRKSPGPSDPAPGDDRT